MSVASTDYIQATIEIFGFFITVVIAWVFLIITGNKRKSEKYLFSVILLAGLALLLDAGWYIFDGGTSNIAGIINRWSNFLIFVCNPLTLAAFNRYLCLIIEESNHKPNKAFVLFVNSLTALCFFIPVSNLLYKWMYYIDSANVYCRLNGWYVYTVLNGSVIISNIIMVAFHAKHISYKRRITLYVFLIAPFLGIALQATNMGISFIQLGSAIGSFGVLISYLTEWIKTEKDGNDVSEERKGLWIIECIFMLMILFVSASIISCILSVQKVSNENSEQSSIALSYMVSETVSDALSEPVNVSKTMANSYVVIKALSDDKLEGTELEKDMLKFMKRIRDEYGYQMIFVASEKTKAYYTYDGLSRYMNVDLDPRDAWYNEFKAKQIPCELNIDNDKDNNMTLAVFVNMEVRNEKDELLGVCGAAMSVESLLDILKKYEDEYYLDIALIDEQGIIQIDTNTKNIGAKSTYDDFYCSDSDSIRYEKSKTKARITKHLKNFDWHMVIDDNNPNKLNIIKIILPSMVIYFLAVVFIVLFSIYYGENEKRRAMQLKASKLLSETDRLTGVNNRNAFEAFQKIADSEITEKTPVQIIMIDINGLKTVNDTLGHMAGDELIVGATNCIKGTIGQIGTVYRIGGDEFITVSFEGEEKVEGLISVLKKETDVWSGDLVNELAISIGTSSSTEAPGKTFNELVKMADERMYADKNEYYRRTGKDRRMSW